MRAAPTGLKNTEKNMNEQLVAKGGDTAVHEKKRLTIFGVEFVYLAVLGIGMAFVGWLAENTVKAVTDGIIDSRFHVLPFISPYALIPFAVHIALGSADDIAFFGKKLFKVSTKKTKVLSNIITIAVICGAVFLGELAVGNLWDILFGVQLWDYSDLPLQVTQYAGLIPSLGYGIGAWLLFKFAYTPLLNLCRKKLNFKVAKIIVAVLGTLIVADTVIMCIHIAVTGEALMLWQLHLW